MGRIGRPSFSRTNRPEKQKQRRHRDRPYGSTEERRGGKNRCYGVRLTTAKRPFRTIEHYDGTEGEVWTPEVTSLGHKDKIESLL